MQELGKSNLKTSIIKWIRKYMSFTINNKLSFIDNFQLLRSSLVSVKNLSKDDFKYLSKEFDDNILHLVRQK